eukprot:scaffold88843_cov31-Tisochrysis_lutea.AAC.1
MMFDVRTGKKGGRRRRGHGSCRGAQRTEHRKHRAWREAGHRREHRLCRHGATPDGRELAQSLTERSAMGRHSETPPSPSLPPPSPPPSSPPSPSPPPPSPPPS